MSFYLTKISGCFYVDSCVILSEILGQNQQKMKKLRKDILTNGIDCFISKSVADEVTEKIQSTSNFLGNILKETIIVYLEDSITNPRDLTSINPTNNDLHILKEAFLTVNINIKYLNLITDPFRMVEEWLVEKFDDEISKNTKQTIGNIIINLTKIILQEVVKINMNYERIVQLEANYIHNSNQTPDNNTNRELQTLGIHRPDSDHISVIKSHFINTKENAIFLTLDFGIIKKWNLIKNVFDIIVCDPIYGLSHLRK